MRRTTAESVFVDWTHDAVSASPSRSLQQVRNASNGLSAPLSQAVVRDFTRWPVSDIIESSEGFLGGPTAPTWDGQLQVMRDFMMDRLAWMDANLP